MVDETEQSAKDQLVQLENAAMAGEPVTPAELVEARERVTLSGLIAKGAAARAEEKRRAKDEVLRETAKAEAAELFGGHEGDCLAAYDAAFAAVENLVAVIERGNARIGEAAGILKRGGVPVRYASGLYAEGVDMANYAAMEDGGTASSVTVDGMGHGRESAALWVAAAVHTVARKHRGLPLPYGGGVLEGKLNHDKPNAVKGRHV